MSARTSTHRDGGSGLAKYLNEISKIPQLTREQEYELAHRIRRAAKQVEELSSVLVNGSGKFVAAVTARYKDSGIDSDDLLKEGNAGLVEAAKGLDPESGFHFIPYATWRILQQLQRALEEQRSPARPSFRSSGILAERAVRHQRMAQDLRREPTALEFAEELGVGVDELGFNAAFAAQLGLGVREVQAILRACAKPLSEIRRAEHELQEAMRLLAQSNLRFVVSIANRYRGCGMETIDLIHEGNVGLIEAAKRFDPEKGVKFISYAVWWIRQAIMQALAEQSGAVRLPIKQAGVLYKISNKHQDMTQKLGREPSVVELAKDLSMEISEVEDIMRVSRKSLSIETPLNEDGSSRFVDLMEAKDTPPVDEGITQSSLVGQVEEIIKELKEKEQEVIRLRFGLSGQDPLTLEEVGTKLHLSRERIRQIEKKAKEALRRKAKARKLIDFLS